MTNLIRIRCLAFVLVAATSACSPPPPPTQQEKPALLCQLTINKARSMGFSMSGAMLTSAVPSPALSDEKRTEIGGVYGRLLTDSDIVCVFQNVQGTKWPALITDYCGPSVGSHCLTIQSLGRFDDRGFSTLIGM